MPTLEIDRDGLLGAFDGAAGVVVGFLALTAAVAFYLLPTIIGRARRIRHLDSVAIINFFLGWTVVGWLIALTKSLRATPHHRHF